MPTPTLPLLCCVEDERRRVGLPEAEGGGRVGADVSCASGVKEGGAVGVGMGMPQPYWFSHKYREFD